MLIRKRDGQDRCRRKLDAIRIGVLLRNIGIDVDGFHRKTVGCQGVGIEGVQPAAGIQSIQQVLEAGSLNGLTAAQSMVTVWGHQDGDQLVADVIVYQNPLLLK